MIDEIAALCWDETQLAEALGALAERGGLRGPASQPAPGSSGRGAADDASLPLEQRVERLARQLGLEAEAVETSYPQVEQLLLQAGPALLQLPGEQQGRLLLLLGGGGKLVALLGSDLQVRRLPPAQIKDALCSQLAEPLRVEVDRLLRQASVPQGRRYQARQAILNERLSGLPVAGGWLLRLPPGASIWRQLRVEGLTGLFARFTALHALQYLLWLLSWWLIGRGALSGRLEIAWLLGWALLLLSLVPLRMLEAWWQSRLAIGLGILLKRRLLHGALRLQPEETRHEGIGQFLGRVIESEAVETLSLRGGFTAVVAALELGVAALVLGAGPGGLAHVVLLLAWLAVVLLLAWRYHVQRRGWTTLRLAMTHELIEQMVGHRTRLAQEAPETWHDHEDSTLARYIDESRKLDRRSARLQLVPSRAWLVFGLLALLPTLVAGEADGAALALGLGGVLSAYLALRSLAPGLLAISAALIAWQQIAGLFLAATRPEQGGGEPISAGGNRYSSQPLIDAHQLSFRYQERGAPALQDLSLQIHQGDRLLIEGPSGGGKSTLAAMLTGLRDPQAGLLLLHGLDRQSLGADAWRRQVVAAPQFHENHIFTETFAFNLLMGRRWPPSAEDMAEAEALCRELGLGELLDHMPAGMLQMVGETGWQLSHGERSRLFMARALLQGAELIILDESFAALDPQTLYLCLQCALRRAPTLVVIAHP